MTNVGLTEEMLAWESASDEALGNFEAKLDPSPCDKCETSWAGSFTDSAGRPMILSCEDNCKLILNWRRRHPIIDHTVFKYD